MTRTTSINAYRIGMVTGLLSTERGKVYRALAELGRPATASEVAQAMNAPDKSKVSARLTELRQRGVAEEHGTDVCPVTNRNAILWGAVDVEPREPRAERTRTIAEGWVMLDRHGAPFVAHAGAVAFYTNEPAPDLMFRPVAARIQIVGGAS